MNRFWNKTILGWPCALFMFMSAVLNKVAYKFTSTIYKYNLGKCGKGVILMPGLKFRYPKSIEIGNNVVIARCVELSNSEIPTGRLLIEDGASIDTGCYVDYSGGLILRSGAHLAWGVYVSTHDHGYDYQEIPIGRSLEIGENAFIGAQSIVLHNCNYIGKNAVIGSGSVVTKDVPDFAVVAGNPAKIIKYINESK